MIIRINKFMLALNNVYRVLDSHGFPKLILHLVYVPIATVILIFNRLRKELLSFAFILVLFCGFLFIMGGLSAALFLAYSGYTIYFDRFDEDGLPKKKN